MQIWHFDLPYFNIFSLKQDINVNAIVFTFFKFKFENRFLCLINNPYASTPYASLLALKEMYMDPKTKPKAY